MNLERIAEEGKGNKNLETIKRIENKKNPSVNDILTSWPFVVVFILSFIKSFTNFSYNGLSKEFGMYFIGDDMFITKMSLAGIVISLFFRFNLGRIYNSLGIRMTYLINYIVEILCGIVLLIYGENKMGFTIYLFLNKLSGCISFLYYNLLKVQIIISYEYLIIIHI